MGERGSEREREIMNGGGRHCAIALLQAPHLCQPWHLYQPNALLMPCHICCCKLLLRPILEDEEKAGRDWEGKGGGSSKQERHCATGLPWVFFNRRERQRGRCIGGRAIERVG